MLSSRDVLAILTQLREGIQGLGGAAELVHDPKVQDAIDALQKELDSIIHDVEGVARQAGIIPTRAIQPRPSVVNRLSIHPGTI